MRDATGGDATCVFASVPTHRTFLTLTTETGTTEALRAPLLTMIKVKARVQAKDLDYPSLAVARKGIFLSTIPFFFSLPKDEEAIRVPQLNVVTYFFSRCQSGDWAEPSMPV